MGSDARLEIARRLRMKADHLRRLAQQTQNPAALGPLLRTAALNRRLALSLEDRARGAADKRRAR